MSFLSGNTVSINIYNTNKKRFINSFKNNKPKLLTIFSDIFSEAATLDQLNTPQSVTQHRLSRERILGYPKPKPFFR